MGQEKLKGGQQNSQNRHSVGSGSGFGDPSAVFQTGVHPVSKTTFSELHAAWRVRALESGRPELQCGRLSSVPQFLTCKVRALKPASRGCCEEWETVTSTPGDSKAGTRSPSRLSRVTFQVKIKCKLNRPSINHSYPIAQRPLQSSQVSLIPLVSMVSNQPSEEEGQRA